MTNCVKIRHTQSVKERLLQAHQVLGITNTMTEQLNVIFNQWAQVRITDKELLKLVQQAMAPSKEVLQKVLDDENMDEYSSRFLNTVERVCEYGFTNETQQLETTKGTLFGAYNAITGYFQNIMHYKNDEAKLKSILFGNGFNKTQAAFNLCLDFAKHGEPAFEMN
jgi:hypothetical protein